MLFVASVSVKDAVCRECVCERCSGDVDDCFRSGSSSSSTADSCVGIDSSRNLKLSDYICCSNSSVGVCRCSRSSVSSSIKLKRSDRSSSSSSSGSIDSCSRSRSSNSSSVDVCVL